MIRLIRNYCLLLGLGCLPAGMATAGSPPALLWHVQQSITVSGRVTGADNSSGLPGVSVQVKGTSRGDITDATGRFTLKVPSSAVVLVFSYTGYTQQEVPLEGRTSVNVVLQVAEGKLQEVVVVGYGQQRKANLTGSLATIDQKALANRPITNASQALQGMPGVFVNQTKGRPGADGATIRIRGVGTLNNSNPLVLVDGVEFPLSDINPNDIESITVLKDAASAAIYGNRAANGVVLVKTKTGQRGRLRVDYNFYTGIQQATILPESITNAVQYMEGKNRALANEGKPAEYNPALIEEYRNGKDPYIYPNTNWFDVMFRTAPIQEHNLRFSGGSDRSVFSISLGYMDQQGILINSWARKYAINSNISVDVTDRLKMGAGLIGTYWVNRESAYTSDEANGEGGLMGLIYRGLPMQVPYAQDGSYADQWVRVPGHNFFRNPLALSYEGFHRNASLRALANVFAEYRLPANIRYRTTVAANMLYATEKYANPQVDLTNPKTGVVTPMGNIPARGVRQISRDSISITNFHTLTWDREWGPHHTAALLGFSVETFTGNRFSASNQGYLDNSLTELDAGSNTPLVSGTSGKSRLLSYFGRINYDYAGKYLLEANFRYDGSSRFATGKRWGFFPSVSGGWRISEEAFLKNTAVSNLKLRASWGRLGNQNIPLFSYVDGVAVGQNYNFNNTVVSGAAIRQLSDPAITWETTAITDIGLDLGFFGNKLYAELDWFSKRTTNILRQIAIPAQVGNLDGPYRNIGTVSNRGIEITAGYQNKAGDFSYNLSGNLTYVKNKVVDLRGQRYYDGNRITAEGYPIDAFYGLKAIGIFQSEDEIKNHAFQNTVTRPGDVKYEDTDHNNIIDNNDRVVIGNSIPRYTYSFVIGAGYKGIELNTFFQGIKDADTYLNGNLAQPYRNGAGVTAEWLTDSWTPEHPDASLPRLTTGNGYPQNYQNSGFWVRDASYLRLKNIQLSYTLPKVWLQRARISQVKVFVNAQNWVTFTKLKLGDPERDLTRSTLIEYPNNKMLTGGVNISL